DKIIIAGPMANVSHPVFRMMESGALASIANKVVFKLWKNPDQLKAMVLNKEVDFVKEKSLSYLEEVICPILF
ncbi:MAG: hypothetical protein LGB05_07315, partial [Sulfurovum sp.]|nr:hypothetical protein [Sulfurovum sp.]MCB4773411.1 hypothetical protein [Sulfurovum sp.]MCB4779816.1 hypothetical protein [Sulfurovum sp.]